MFPALIFFLWWTGFPGDWQNIDRNPMRNPNISVSPSENSSKQKGLSIFEIGRSPCKTTSGMLAVGMFDDFVDDRTAVTQCVFSDQKLPDMPRM